MLLDALLGRTFKFDTGVTFKVVGFNASRGEIKLRQVGTHVSQAVPSKLFLQAFYRGTITEV